MKKFLTLVLALVMVLAIAAPAMAFTADDSDTANVPYELDIYLVDYEGDDFFGFVALPESDRGYAKNEIVAAVVELFVPKGEDPDADGYTSLEFSGSHVSLDVTDNKITGGNATLQTVNGSGTFALDGGKLKQVAAFTANTSKDLTYKWLFFAKVTDDDASLTAKLIDGTTGQKFTVTDGEYDDDIDVTLDGETYNIDLVKTSSSANGQYTITGDYDDEAFEIIIDVNKSFKSTGMTVDGSVLAVTAAGKLGIVDGTGVATSGATFNAVMDVYEGVVIDVFGMDFFNIGNYVRPSFFEGLTSGSTLEATVEIEPWTAYVSVPDNIVVDPPKTGDAASILGFVMIVLAAAAVVAVRKVRA